MAYEQKEGDIAVFKVKEKTNDRGPDWTGKALIDGQEKQVSLWIKNDGMLAGQIKEKFTPKKPVQETFQQPLEMDEDGGIPF